MDRHYLFAFYLEIEHDLIFFPTCELQGINWHEKQSPPTEISTNSVVGVKVNILWYFKSVPPSKKCAESLFLNFLSWGEKLMDSFF